MLETVSGVYKAKMDSQEDVGNLRNYHAEKSIGEIIDRQRLNWTLTWSIKHLYKASLQSFSSDVKPKKHNSRSDFRREKIICRYLSSIIRGTEK